MFGNSIKNSSRVDEIFFRIYLGMAYIEAGETDKAIASLKRVLRLNPNAPDALLYLGRAYMMRGECDQAMPSLARLDGLWKKADADYVRNKELDQLKKICAADKSE
jgi:cytochrome c-type biogenesis protein CcmH/NrfG